MTKVKGVAITPSGVRVVWYDGKEMTLAFEHMREAAETVTCYGAAVIEMRGL